MNRLTPEDIKRRQQDHNPASAPVMVDVRSAEEFAAGHAEGAVHIPLEELTGRSSELPRNRPVVTYCNMFHPGSSRGERAAVQLAELGFDASVLEGGFPAWREAGAAVQAGEDFPHQERRTSS